MSHHIFTLTEFSMRAEAENYGLEVSKKRIDVWDTVFGY